MTNPLILDSMDPVTAAATALRIMADDIADGVRPPQFIILTAMPDDYDATAIFAVNMDGPSTRAVLLAIADHVRGRQP